MAILEGVRSRVAADSRSRARGLGHLPLYLVLLLLAVFFLFPFFWAISSSLKAPDEILNFPPSLFPSVPKWQNYVRVFERAPFAQWMSGANPLPIFWPKASLRTSESVRSVGLSHARVPLWWLP